MTRHCCIWWSLMCIMSSTIIVLGLAIAFLYTSNATNEIRQIKPKESSDSEIYSNDFSAVTIIDDHVTTEMSFNIAVDEDFHALLPRAAYFDKRARNKHKSTVVVLTHLSGDVKLVACNVNGSLTRSFAIRPLRVTAWIHYKFNCTHDNVLIHCYDVPAPHIVNNGDVFIVYKNPENESEFVSVRSEYPLFVPKERKSSSTVMVCTTVFDTPPHFGAWIRYQKTLGVDMVRINADESFLSSGAFNDTFFLDSLENGFIQLQVWKEHLPPGALFYHSQALFYQDCLYRYLGVYDYCMCADTDDFLVLRDKRIPGIHELVKRIFIRNGRQVMNTAILQWIRHLEPTEGFNPPEEEIKDGNLIRYMSTTKGVNEGKFRTKSMYKLSAMDELGIHESVQFLTGTTKPWKLCAGVRETSAYVAHVRKKPKSMDRELKFCSDV